jgi:hypothetical protein
MLNSIYLTGFNILLYLRKKNTSTCINLLEESTADRVVSYLDKDVSGNSIGHDFIIIKFVCSLAYIFIKYILPPDNQPSSGGKHARIGSYLYFWVTGFAGSINIMER